MAISTDKYNTPLQNSIMSTFSFVQTYDNGLVLVLEQEGLSNIVDFEEVDYGILNMKENFTDIDESNLQTKVNNKKLVIPVVFHIV